MGNEPPAKPARLSRELRRESILDAAINCMAQRGFHATTMDSIANEAGVNIRLLYRHFGSKDDIVEAVVARNLEETRREVADALRIDDAVAGSALIDHVRELIGRLHDLPSLKLRIEIYAEAARNPKIRSIVERGAAEERAISKIVFRQTFQGEMTEADLDARVDALGLIYDGLIAHGIYAGQIHEQPGRVEALALVIAAMMRPLLIGTDPAF